MKFYNLFMAIVALFVLGGAFLYENLFIFIMGATALIVFLLFEILDKIDRLDERRKKK